MTTQEPTIGASFVVGSDGKPEFREGETKRHYRIRLRIEHAPEASESVTYRLHDSYYHPVREVFRESQEGTFDQLITSYGDFELTALISGSTTPIIKPLSEALEESLNHLDDKADMTAFRFALEQIKTY